MPSMTRLEEQHYDHNKRVGQHAAEGDANMPQVLRGATSAFKREGSTFFRPYIAGFIAKKLELSGIGPDDGTQKFLAAPVCEILNASENPVETVKDLIADVPKEDRKKVLDLVLQAAYAPKTANALIIAGADVNAFHGGAVAKALTTKNRGLLILFNKHGGNLRLANESYELGIPPQCLKTINKFFKCGQ